jgi:hypothetical protein
LKSVASSDARHAAKIADRGDRRLNERYIREWASTMAAAGYIEYQPADATFRMNPRSPKKST